MPLGAFEAFVPPPPTADAAAYLYPPDDDPELIDAYIHGVASVKARSLGGGGGGQLGKEAHSPSLLWVIAGAHLSSYFCAVPPPDERRGGGGDAEAEASRRTQEVLAVRWSRLRRLGSLVEHAPAATLAALFSSSPKKHVTPGIHAAADEDGEEDGGGGGGGMLEALNALSVNRADLKVRISEITTLLLNEVNEKA